MQYVYLGVIRSCLIAVESSQFLMIVQFKEESSKFNWLNLLFFFINNILERQCRVKNQVWKCSSTSTDKFSGYLLKISDLYPCLAGNPNKKKQANLLLALSPSGMGQDILRKNPKRGTGILFWWFDLKFVSPLRGITSETYIILWMYRIIC